LEIESILHKEMKRVVVEFFGGEGEERWGERRSADLLKVGGKGKAMGIVTEGKGKKMSYGKRTRSYWLKRIAVGGIREGGLKQRVKWMEI